MRATNPRKSMKCGIYHTRVLVAVYSFLMKQKSDFKILIACEESQTICKAFRKQGFEAFSCDLLPCSGGHPEWHYQQDVFEVINNGTKWDLMIAHPEYTYLTAANSYMKNGCSKYTKEEAVILRKNAVEFFMKLANSNIKHIAIENPIGIMSKVYRKPDQIIQPYQFGDTFSKATCLWLKNLPLLKQTSFAEFTHYRCKCGNVFEKKYGKYGCCDYPAKPRWKNQSPTGQNNVPPGEDQRRIRAKTFDGIAEGIATQWGSFLLNGY